MTGRSGGTGSARIGRAGSSRAVSGWLDCLFVCRAGFGMVEGFRRIDGMRQVLFEVPGIGLKIFGYGLMLFLSFLASMNLAARLAQA